LNQESESVTNDAVSNDSAASDEAKDPGAVSDQALTSEGAAAGQPAPDPEEEAAPPAGDSSSLETNPAKETPATPPTSPPATGSGTVDPALLPFVDQAKADLAGRLGVDADAIAVISAEMVTWPDGSLGCPQPGMGYAQVLVSGSLVVLQVNGVSYEYHSAAGEDPFYCPTPTPPAPAGYGDK